MRHEDLSYLFCTTDGGSFQCTVHKILLLLTKHMTCQHTGQLVLSMVRLIKLCVVDIDELSIVIPAHNKNHFQHESAYYEDRKPCGIMFVSLCNNF
jgi:hypothetical protein